MKPRGGAETAPKPPSQRSRPPHAEHVPPDGGPRGAGVAAAEYSAAANHVTASPARHEAGSRCRAGPPPPLGAAAAAAALAAAAAAAASGVAAAAAPSSAVALHGA